MVIGRNLGVNSKFLEEANLNTLCTDDRAKLQATRCTLFVNEENTMITLQRLTSQGAHCNKPFTALFG